MRYRKGSKVEVLSQSEVPSGSWRGAEVLYGNGHNYTVRYDMHSGGVDEASVGKVSRKLIRPCPPSLGLMVSWAPGDVLEVFHNFSWKIATVSKVLGRNFYSVRLLGSSQEFEIRKFDLRMRQSWKNDQWIVIGKDFRNHEDGKLSEQSTLKYSQRNKIHMEDVSLNASKTRKRGSPCGYSQVERDERTVQKYRLIEKEGRRNRMFSANPLLLTKRVEAGASTQEMVGEKDMYSSCINRSTHCSNMDTGGKKLKGAVGRDHIISSESNNGEGDTSSVGSCSSNSQSSFRLPGHWSTGPVKGTDCHSSDAESVCRSEYEEANCLLLTEKDLEAETHRLELHAYRCTLEAFHASGPLSWEQETLVTDLRISLHISNDEHLMEIRNLISSANEIPIR